MARRKARILQLIDGFTVGGAERIVLTLAKSLDRERFDVLPCALHHSGPIEDELKAAGIDYRLLGFRRRSVLTGPIFLADVKRMSDALVKFMADLSIDVLHTHLPNSTLIGIAAARRMRQMPVCATVHSVVLAAPRGRLSLRGWLMRTGMRTVFPRADRIIAVSEEVARSVQSTARVPTERITVIPNGVDPERFRFVESKHALRAKLGLPTNRLVLISVGRLETYKGHAHLLGALARIPPSERPLTVVAGDGPERHSLEARAATLGLAGDVRLLGNRQDIPALLTAADIFVLPSLWEGIPLALLEAMASTLPAVATAVGGNVGVIENGKSGVLVPAADEQRLAEALHGLIRDPARREGLAHAARQRFDAHFGLRPFVDAHEHLYEELLRKYGELARSKAS